MIANKNDNSNQIVVEISNFKQEEITISFETKQTSEIKWKRKIY